MKKLIEFLRASNRYKHLLGGFVVGLLALGVYPAVYSSVVAASCLELKDKLDGGIWDWVDWIITVVGGGIAAMLWFAIKLWM